MMKKLKKIVLIVSFSLLFLLLTLEFVLRYCFGFCDAVLYRYDRCFEYIAQPNQKRYRFFSHINYNTYSQRSDEVSTKKRKILGLGDSVINGGTLIDQDSIATSIISKETDIQMLNISCGSWGPDNCAAYLQKYGTFDAEGIYLVVSSHDAYDTMDNLNVVGVFPEYPNKQYRLAVIELFERYVKNRIKRLCVTNSGEMDPDEIVLNHVRKKSNKFNPGFGQLKHIADSLSIPMIVCLHAEREELDNKQYNSMGQLIIQWCRENNVIITKDLDKGVNESMYLDVIHFNSKGHKFLAKIIEEDIIKVENR